jgi:hypothetical protein
MTGHFTGFATPKYDGLLSYTIVRTVVYKIPRFFPTIFNGIGALGTC